MKTLKTLLVSISMVGSLSAIAGPAPNVLDLKESITDNAIIYPESYEIDTQKLLQGWFMKNYTASDDRYLKESDVKVSDKELQRRLAALPTIIDMPYNSIVRSYIEKYTRDSRPQVEAILGMSLYYMPIFEQALEEQGLPLELKYLPVIESGLDPNAVSKHGAAGLWQFMLNTAKGLGMEVNSLVDERRDPYLSSEMAAAYLKGLYDAYGDWSLAIAAYNCGPGTLNKAIRRAGGEASSHDFWSVYQYLPAETRGYVPMFIAANYVMAYYPQHNISPVLPVKPLVTDTIHICERIHFDQISNVLDIPVEELRILNPQFRQDLIPGNSESTYTLILPSQQIHAYIMSENDIRNFNVEKYARREVADPGEVPADAVIAIEEEEIWPDVTETVAANSSGNSGKKNTLVHKVTAGETLTSIAAAYSVSVNDIKQENNLRRNAVRVGQQLRITTTSDKGTVEVAAAPQVQKPAAQKPATQKPAANNKNNNTKNNNKKTTPKAKTTTYSVVNGDNLSKIAKKYGTTADAIKKENGLKTDVLQPGQSLKIPSKKTDNNKKGKKKK